MAGKKSKKKSKRVNDQPVQSQTSNVPTSSQRDAPEEQQPQASPVLQDVGGRSVARHPVQYGSYTQPLSQGPPGFVQCSPYGQYPPQTQGGIQYPIEGGQFLPPPGFSAPMQRGEFRGPPQPQFYQQQVMQQYFMPGQPMHGQQMWGQQAASELQEKFPKLQIKYSNKLIGSKDARQYVDKSIKDVNAARPQEFFNLPEAARVSKKGRKEQFGIALRPNRVNEYCKIWESIELEQNLFSIKSKQEVAYQYDFQVYKKFKNKFELVNSRTACQQAFCVLAQMWKPSTVYDGRSTVWDIKKNLKEMDYRRVQLGKKSVYVVLQFAKEVPMDEIQEHNLERNVGDRLGWLIPTECIRVLDSALRHNALMNQDDYKVLGSKVFDLTQSCEPLRSDKAMELLYGYNHSVKVVTEGLFLNLNTLYKIAPNTGATLLDFFKNCGVQNFDRLLTIPGILRKIEGVLKGMNISQQISLQDGKVQKMTKKVFRIFNKGSDYWIKDLNMTVEQYYWDKYKYKIKYPKFNLLDVSAKGSKPVLIPIELCKVARGEFEKFEMRYQAELIRQSAKLPHKRHEDIQEALEDVQKRILEAPAKFWVQQLNSTWLKSEGFKLPVPVIEYGNKVNVKPVNGQWNGYQKDQNQIQHHPFFDPQQIDSWAVLNFSDESDKYIEEFLRKVQSFGREVGMEISSFSEHILIKGQLESDQVDVEKALEYLDIAQERAQRIYGKPPRILFIIFQEASEQYNMFKSILESNFNYKLKCPSAMILANNFKFVKGWMEKINVKLGGTNQRLFNAQSLCQAFAGARLGKVMLMGADVTHPTNTVKDQKTSIAGVVASVDENFSQYAARIVSQKKDKDETIDAMDFCSRELLETFKTKNGVLPDTIIMYRDGISQGQYNSILTNEFRAMKAAAARFDKPGQRYNPKITFIVVQKRHHHRPRAVNAQGADGMGDTNLAPGTVLDSSGLHPFQFQFLLQSHLTIKGTNRPAIYSVLVDEIGFGAEQLQLLTYWLTHTYQRCTKSVSIVTPAYYSHHACTRGRIHENFLKSQRLSKIQVASQLKDTMFWL